MGVLHARNSRKTLEPSSATPSHYVPGKSGGAVSRAVTNRLLSGPTRREDGFKEKRWFSEVRRRLAWKQVVVMRDSRDADRQSHST